MLELYSRSGTDWKSALRMVVEHLVLPELSEQERAITKTRCRQCFRPDDDSRTKVIPPSAMRSRGGTEQ